MKKKLAALAIVALTLTGCASGDTPMERPNGLYEVHQKLSDGRTVTCLTSGTGLKSGVSCDWANAH